MTKLHYTQPLRQAALLAALVGAAILLASLGFAANAVASESFGIESFEDVISATKEGPPATVAGSHPYSLTATMMFNHEVEEENEEETYVKIYGDPKNVEVNLPRGLVVNPNATDAKCTEQQFESEAGCPNASAAGVVTTYINFFGGRQSVPVYNMVPPPGVPAQFAFNPAGALPVHLNGKLRTGGDYGLTGSVIDIPKGRLIYGTKFTLWGDPSSEAHDKERGQCDYGIGIEKVKEEEEEQTKEIEEHGQVNPNRTFFCAVERKERAQLTMPTACSGEALITTATANSWQEPNAILSAPTAESPAVTGCGNLAFTPAMSVRPAEPSTPTADSPSGLSVDLRVPQEESLKGLAESTLKKVVVTLPAGMQISPSGANGRQSCSPAQIALSSPGAPTCPDASKLGEVEAVTPLLETPLKGFVYLAQQGSFEGSLVGLYLAMEGSGALVKLGGKVSLDPSTGQITATFDNNPQLPFSDLKVKFAGGPSAGLMTPLNCGTYSTVSALTPWSGTGAVTSNEAFSVNSGCGGGFLPSFSAGAVNNQGGAFSPISVSLSRKDGEQRLGGVQVTAPAGVAAVLKGVAQCAEAQAQAGTCGPESLIGSASAAAGPGPAPYWITNGRVYLTGPYKGAPFGLSIVVPVVAGPFNLGTIVVRAQIAVNPYTAQVTVTSDPLPQMVNNVEGLQSGIPTDLKTVVVTLNRPGFVFNPTNCKASKVSASITSAQGATAAVSSPFEAANCASLPFKPQLTALTQAKTSKANGASLHVRVVSGAGQANIGAVKVDLPKQLPSRLTTLQKACLAAVFEANPAACPAASVVGEATAITPVLTSALHGPAYLVSHGGAAFPDLEIVLQGEGITVILDSNTHITKGITSSTFKSIPDVPVSTFELILPEGPHSILASNGNLCKSKLVMPTAFVGQNGAVIHQSTPISVTGCPKVKALTRSQKLEAALKACHKKPKGAKRSGCEKAARKKYGVVKKGKKKK